MDRYLVVSSDGHAGLHASDYRPYVDSKFRDAFDAALPIQIEATKKMSDYFLITEINEEWRRGNEEELQGAWDPTARDKMLDNDGIVAEVLFPDGVTEMNAPPFGAGFTMRPDGSNGELMWAGCDAHNRFLAEFVQTAPERRIGLACIPVYWDVDLAVAKAHQARKDGLAGVLLPPMWDGFPGYNDTKYDPFWAACQDLNMPVHFHSGPAPMEQFFGPIPPREGHAIPPGAVGAYLMEVHFWMTRGLTFMLWGGVFTRFPKLKCAVTEGTSAWVPDYLDRLRFHYRESRESQKLGDFRGHLAESPVDTFRKNVRIGASCMSRREAEMRHEIGLRGMMWGSDYPHPEGSWPVTRNAQFEALHGLPEDEIGLILGENAVEFYDLDREKLAPLAARIGPEKTFFQQAVTGQQLAASGTQGVPEPMKVSVDQYCINVSDLAKSVDFYTNALGLEITHRVEEKDFREVILQGEGGNRIQLAWQRNHQGEIEHGNGFWKLYLQTDDCKGLYQRCIDWGARSHTEPVQLEEWPVIAAFVLDPDGYLVEILETFGEAEKVSGSMSHD